MAGLALVCSVSGPASADREKVLVGFKRTPNEAVVQSVGGRVKYVYHLVPAVTAAIGRVE